MYTKIQNILSIIVVSEVNDLIIAMSNLENINNNVLRLLFKKRDLGQLLYFLGNEFSFCWGVK